jgi:hypothetical protein
MTTTQTEHWHWNQESWEEGQKVEDAIRPSLNSRFDAEFVRSDNKFDKIDFYDWSKKIAVEVKGRKIRHDAFRTTLITTPKIVHARELLKQGWAVHLVFVFQDKTLCHQLTGSETWRSGLGGKYRVPHFFPPVSELQDYGSW